MEINEWTIAKAFARREFSYSCFHGKKQTKLSSYQFVMKTQTTEHRNTKRTNPNIHEEMILFYTVMGIALALVLEHMYHLDHLIEGLGILMLHELQNRSSIVT